jgi:hypothetical protein
VDLNQDEINMLGELVMCAYEEDNFFLAKVALSYNEQYKRIILIAMPDRISKWYDQNEEETNKDVV